MSEKAFEFRLISLALEQRGSINGKEDINAVAFTLHYPRAGTPSVTTIKKFKAGKPIPNNFSTLSYEKQVIFKEKMQGETQLTIDVAAIDNPSKFEKFFANIFKGIFKAVFGKAVEGIDNIVTGAVTETIGESIFDAIDAEESIQKIGRAIIALKTSDLLEEGEITSELRVPKKIVKVVESDDEDDEEITTILMKENQLNGTITLSYKMLT